MQHASGEARRSVGGASAAAVHHPSTWPPASVLPRAPIIHSLATIGSFVYNTVAQTSVRKARGRDPAP